eukprot:3627318-Pyramimonas_sp.AAC.1
MGSPPSASSSPSSPTPSAASLRGLGPRLPPRSLNSPDEGPNHMQLPMPLLLISPSVGLSFGSRTVWRSQLGVTVGGHS